MNVRREARARYRKALSAQRGGATRFKRDELIHELMWESRELERRMKLNGIDKELHDAYATRKEYMEVKVLHGYSTLLWTGNARRALEREHNKLVAITTSAEVVDDILEWMLEGWYFGERESKQVVAGYVPSLKKDGFVKPGTETTKATAIKDAQIDEKKKLKKENKKKKKDAEKRRKQLVKNHADKFGGIENTFDEKKGDEGDEGDSDSSGGDFNSDDEEEQGTPWEKILPIATAAQFRMKKEKVVKKGDDRDHALNETEQTMKFGLFCLTFQ